MTRLETLFIGLGTILVLVCVAIAALACGLSPFAEAMLAVLISLGTGIITSVLILWLVRKDREIEMSKRYEAIEGTYKRIFIAESGIDATAQKNLNDDNVDLSIEVSHESENHFRIIAEYWKSKGHRVEGHVTFVDHSLYMATGSYRYLTAETTAVGAYRIMRFNSMPDRLHVVYEYVPANGESGFEVWEKVHLR